MEENRTDWNVTEPRIGLRSPDLLNSSSSVNLQGNFEIDLEDTNWILTSSFIIFTMQTGFGMLESGCVSIKNEANIMMKNLADISLGGLTYWIFGYGMSFGQGPYSNPVIGVGDFLIDPPVGDSLMGPVFASFLFQLSFATTATTIVSGAMAERCNFKAYCLFSFMNTIVYCVPAGWVWGSNGFLSRLGAVDIAGSGPVHLIGGSSAFASALMLGPRLGRYAKGTAPLPLGNPVNAVMGTFVLWWGWLAFNSGSTYGVSGAKWQYAARAAVMTMMGSFGGGCFGLIFTLVKNKGKADVMELINSVLGSLVSVTAGCFLYRAWESILIGLIGAAIACATAPLFDKLRVDDPVGASSVHGACGLWGVLAVGLFADNPIPMDTTNGRSGLFKGGGWYLLGVQALTGVCLIAWGVTVTMLLLWLIDCVLPIRMDPYEELLGADLTEHRIRHGQVGVSRAVSALRPYHRSSSIEDVGGIGVNTGHSLVVDKLYEAQLQKKKNRFSGLQIFKNKAFEEDEQPKSKIKNEGFLNRRNGDPENELHIAIDSMADELNGTAFKNREKISKVVPEELKGKKFKELSVTELESLGEMNANEDRFRHRLNEDNYNEDVKRANMTWID
ncbi:putative ammonium transporter 2 [Cydia pomonella]|uniref:putative ammonium transporter 2 n=1 Tax=Cydia pomonella TaxID=82600 RepID=UPI002ADD7308|nr:putative ammonium transporter 2 [Cydia pomonella]XP_061726605.1 putative ammonium transporter 2 [Cydia pomonella]XP_061726606.1 putative ammonium transporter 2 [Cydia pomonella]XP_061726607.1 putative ammonium transporter 2 [Cydia pomonella]XP_061726608.1 putative ammonium transporter 2 [Cydia pomonella]XP_061726609.1 putative ammonium transporter 2 [Cydia pomonella]XP_061726611.1 putative ammonium transporter 2 [Cydia pomonella]